MNRRYVMVGAVLGTFLVGSAALASSGLGDATPGTDGQPSTPAAVKQDAVIGRTIERFQRSSACDLIDVGDLQGNWTHGSYVSAVAGLGDPTLVPGAAKSDCGKPVASMQHGPPAHAGGQGKPDDAGVDRTEEPEGTLSLVPASG